MSLLNELFKFEKEYEGDPYDSESDEDDDTAMTESGDLESDEYIEYQNHANNIRCGQVGDGPGVQDMLDDDTDEENEHEVIGDVKWEADSHILPPNRVEYPKTTVKDDFKHQFQTPESSFLAFIPLTFFVHWTTMCNLHRQEGARADFVTNCTEALINTNWEMKLQMQMNGGVASQNTNNDNIMSMMGVTGQMEEGNGSSHASIGVIGAEMCRRPILCSLVSFMQYRVLKRNGTFRMPTKDGKACMVCCFEERGRGKSVVGCLSHGICACSVMQPRRQEGKPLMKEGTEDLITDWSWICPDNTLTCWEKAHLWYIP